MIIKCSYVDGGIEFRHVETFSRYKDQAATAGDGDEDDPFWVMDVMVEVFTDSGVSLGVFDVKAMPPEDKPSPVVRMVPKAEMESRKDQPND
jgi:hypothetical protein